MRYLLACLLLVFASNAFSDTTLIIHSGAGGLSHRMAIELVPVLTKILNEPVVIDIRPGGDGYVGAKALVESGGSTLLLGTPKHWVDMSPKIDLTTDANVLAYVGMVPGVIVARHGKYTSLSMALASPNLSYGVSGASPTTNLLKKLVENSKDPIDVKYKSGSMLLLDVLNGSLDIAASNIDVVEGFVSEGKLDMLGVIGEEKIGSVLPLKALGLSVEKQYKYYNNFFIWSNKAFPSDKARKLEAGIQSYMGSKESIPFRSKLNLVYTKKNPINYLRDILE